MTTAIPYQFNREAQQEKHNLDGDHIGAVMTFSVDSKRLNTDNTSA